MSRGRLAPHPVLFGQVVRVADGSGRFVDVTPEHRPTEFIYDVFFVDREHGWVGFTDPGEASGRLVRTDNGGRAWEPTTSTARVHQSAGSRAWLFFLDRRTGWTADYAAAAPAGGIYRTTDGGRTWTDWTELPEPGPVRFETPDHGWLAGSSVYGATGGLHETVDGGTTWTKRIVTPPAGTTADDLAYRLPTFAGHRGVLPVSVGDQQVAFYTSADDGRSWQQTATAAVAGGAKVALATATPSIWWAVGGDGGPGFVTADGGRTWTSRRRAGLPVTITDLEAKDERTAWASAFDQGQPLRLYTTSDGGETWQVQD